MPPTPCAAALTFALAALIAGCADASRERAGTAPASDAAVHPPAPADPLPAVAALLPAPRVQSDHLDNPSGVDLRPRLTAMGFTPRPQGRRGTCSIFTTCSSLEFAYAELTGERLRLSPEYVNWAAGKAAGRPSDGNFFHNALNGFDKYGVCDELTMPYQKAFDAAHAPSAAAAAQAKSLRDRTRGQLVIHWIVPWQAGKTGVNEEQFTEIRRVLARGYPVAAGSGHSRLLVGYTDDAKLPGGGEFLTEDSALNRFDKVTFDFVRTQVNDVFWIEAVGTTHRAERPIP
jgi:hypothetical protein